MVGFIDAHRAVHGVEPICQVLAIAPSTYHAHKAKERYPAKRSARAVRNADLRSQIERVWKDNFAVYGARKVWRALRREGTTVARCSAERLMRRMEVRGAVRGRRFKRTTIPDELALRPADLVRRNFTARAPN